MAPNWENVERAKQNILTGKRCDTCKHYNDPYGDCPYEPNWRHERPQCCHKYRERY